MSKILEIIKSFFIPQKMKRYRYMSVLIAIIIFVATVYIFIWQFKVTSTNKKDEYINNNKYGALGYYEMNDGNDFDFNAFKANNYRIKEQKLITSRADNGEYDTYTLTYIKDGKTRIMHMIFDPYGIKLKQVLDIVDKYKTTYEVTDSSSKEDQTRAVYVGEIIHIESLKNPALNQDARMAELKALSMDDLTDIISKFTTYDYYNITLTEGAEEYLVAYNQMSIMIQVPLHLLKEGDYVPAQTASNFYYKDSTFDVSQMNNTQELGQRIASDIANLIIAADQASYNLQIFGYVLLFPIIIALILWLLFRKRGNLKTYKEYYNIASISSIVPLILTFVVGWFWITAITLYGLIFSVFYLFVLYRVNLTPEEV